MKTLHRLLLSLYPRRHRSRFGPEIESFVEEALADARTRGRFEVLRFLLRYSGSTVWHATALRMGAERTQRDHGKDGAPIGGGMMQWIGDLNRDVRLALRGLIRRPVFTAIALLTLTLGIGGTTAVFTMVDQVLLTPLPFEDGERVVWVMNQPEPGQSFIGLSDPFYLEIEAALRTSGPSGTGLEAVAAVAPTSVNIGGEDRPERVEAEMITPSLFNVLGTPPVVGRGFGLEEGRAGAAPVVVLSHDLWARRFGADPSAVGRTLRVGSRERTIVGVMPPAFTVFGNAELWVPLAIEAGDVDPSSAVNNNRAVIARLASGLDEAEAELRLSAVAERIRTAYPDATEPSYGLGVHAYREWAVGEIRPALLLLLGAVALVLLIACANLANLLLIRHESRRREFALRRALGAERVRLVRQLLAEAALIGLLGAILGITVGVLAIRLTGSLVPPELDLPVAPTPDMTVLVVGLALGLGSALLFGLIPALRAVRPDQLSEGGRSVSGGRSSLRSTLVVAEVALATTLLTGAALLVGSLAHMNRIDPGFSADGRFVGQVTLDETYDGPSAATFHRRLVEDLESRPGVEEAAVGQWIPLTGRVNWGFTVEDQPDAPVRVADYSLVGPGYFRVMGMRVERGREFAWDDADGPPTVIVSESFAASVWPGEDALGKRIRVRIDEPEWHEVVGVVGDVRNRSLTTQPTSLMYFPPRDLPFSNPRTMRVVLRTTQSHLPVGALLRDAVAAVDPSVPAGEVQAMEDIVSGSEARRRFMLWLLGTFAALALALSATGLYGVLSYTVSQQTREIGVRMALGADARTMRRSILGQSGVLAGLGLMIGLGGAAGLSRFLESFLFGVGRTDLVTYGAVALFLATVATLAAWIPARRATLIDPSEALRTE